ncbi:MAG: hypothetical protein ABSE43_12950 [Steroidobacteraceae bacterium]|jgi:hypothetical protein
MSIPAVRGPLPAHYLWYFARQSWSNACDPKYWIDAASVRALFIKAC